LSYCLKPENGEQASLIPVEKSLFVGWPIFNLRFFCAENRALEGELQFVNDKISN
jgi:hypothetical protein